jgi:hypothetical protein
LNLASQARQSRTDGERQDEVTTMLLLVVSICMFLLALVTLCLYLSDSFTNRKGFQLGASPKSRTTDLKIAPVVVEFRVSDAGRDNRRVSAVVNNYDEGNTSLTIQSPVPQIKDKKSGEY